MEQPSYYDRNKQARCEYQRKYYQKNKDKINRKRQIEEAVDPEKIERRLKYNREYYLKNRERLLKRRAERYQDLKKAQASDSTAE